MKILALTNLFPPHYLGGYELICFHTVTALHARGHDIRVLTSDHGIQGSGNRLTIPGEPHVQRTLKIHGFYGHPWLGIRRLRFLERHNNHMLRAAVAQFRPQLVYVWNMGGLSKSMLLTLQDLNVPTAFYLSDHWIARGLTSDVWLNWWNRQHARAWHRLARQFLEITGSRRRWGQLAPTSSWEHIQFRRISFCSRALRRLTSAAGFKVDHGAVIHPPVNTAEFNTPPKPAGQPMRNLLYAGRLSPDKGVLTALRAMAELRGRFHGRLTLYGGGDSDYVGQLRRFITNEQLPVSFASVGLEQMPRVYPAHDALLFTSEWEEPFALTPLEAMASGLPVIGTTTGGSVELFRHGENALAFTAGNAHELTERILELHANPSLRFRIATAGYCEVRRHYAEPVIADQIESFLQETFDQWHPVKSNASGVSERAARERAPHGVRPVHPERTCMRCETIARSMSRGPQRFTLDGSDDLEEFLDSVCRQTSSAVLEAFPRRSIEGLLLGGGYGRGEGGVLRSSDGHRPYNDLEFYLFLRGVHWFNRRRYAATLHRLNHSLSAGAGVDVEITPITRAKLEQAAPSMFYYDLVAGHRTLLGDDSLLARCHHHRSADKIPLHEASRLLMNRCSGLLFARERLLRVPFKSEDADFVGRNIAKAQLALGDVVLTVFGQYHSSCRTRRERLAKLPPPPDLPCLKQLRQDHAAGVDFKLHPHRSAFSLEELTRRHTSVAQRALETWLWLEQRRLDHPFAGAADYALWPGNKSAEPNSWRSLVLQAVALSPVACWGPQRFRHPRERLFNTLPLLLWETSRLREQPIVRAIHTNLRTNAVQYSELVRSYYQLWSRFN